MHHSISQMKHQLDATLCRFYFCRVTLHVTGASAHHQEYLKLVQRPLVHVLSLQVRVGEGIPSQHAFSFGPNMEMWWLTCNDNTCTGGRCTSLNTPDDGRLRPKHVERPCRNKTCTVLHQVGFYLTYTMMHGNTKLKFRKYMSSTPVTGTPFCSKFTKNLSHSAIGSDSAPHYLDSSSTLTIAM